jgi:Fur family ferric uptake transcriptional regulator
VAAALDEVDEFRSAQELHDMLKHKGDSVGLTTVYRTLQNLADAGEVDVLRTSDGESVYRRCSTGDHHHHLVCRVCGKAVEVEGPAVEKWAEAIAAEHGFVNVAHTVEISAPVRSALRLGRGRSGTEARGFAESWSSSRANRIFEAGGGAQGPDGQTQAGPDGAVELGRLIG